MIPHLRNRERSLQPLGWSGPEAEWIALVCLHSGLFTRAQFCAYFNCRPNRAFRFVRRLLQRRHAVEERVSGLTTTTRPCRISSRPLYRRLRIENARHRRTGSPTVLMRRLLALDYVLEYPRAAWVATEAEKLATFRHLGIPPEALPSRRYTGRTGTVVRYFPLKLPVVVFKGEAWFVYVDPGHQTQRGLLGWGVDHSPLWQALRERGHKVVVVSVARDSWRIDQAQRVLDRWMRPMAERDPSRLPLTGEEEEELRQIRDTIVRGDLEAMEWWGGPRGAARRAFDLVTRQETAVWHAAVRIDHGQTWKSERLRNWPWSG